MDHETLRTAAGRNAARYLKHAARLQAAGKHWLPGWNWAAFVHSTGWFWYRRMYGWSVLNLIAPVLVLALFIFGVQWFVPEERTGDIMMGLWGVYLLFVFLAVPVYADSLYLRELSRAKPPRPPSTGTAVGAFLIIAVPALLAWVVAEAQMDYDNRARTTQGLAAAVEVKREVAAFQEANGRLPGAQEAPQFRHQGTLENVASVAWDASRKAVVVTMGPRFDGKRFEFAAPEAGGTQEWTCRSIDLDPKYLRSSCR